MQPRRLVRRWLVVCLLSFPAALQAQAGSSVAGGRLWIGAGLGMGSARVSCVICDANRHTGLSGYARFGTRIGGRLLVGVEGNGWERGDGGVRSLLYSIDGVAYFYGHPGGGFFTKGGLGVQFYSRKDSVDKLTATVPHVQLGAGYEFRLGSQLWLAPYANLHATTNGSLKFAGGTVAGTEGTNFTIIQAGLGVTWR